MKKKYKTYLLLVAVLIIWGLIGVQIFNYLNPEEINIPKESIAKKIQQKITNKKENYIVKKHISDPFLGSFSIASKKLIKKKKNTQKLDDYPIVTFKGLIKGDDKKSFVVSVNGVQEVIKIGQTFNGVKFISGNSNEIITSYKGQTKKVLLN